MIKTTWFLLIMCVVDAFVQIKRMISFFVHFKDSYVATLPGAWDIKFGKGAVVAAIVPLAAIFILIKQRKPNNLWFYLGVKVWLTITIIAQALGGFAKTKSEFLNIFIYNSGWDVFVIMVTIFCWWHYNSTKPRYYFCDRCINQFWDLKICPDCGKANLKPAN